MQTRAVYACASDVVRALEPIEPVYCIYPHVVRRVARRFLEGFPGRVLYAVKANAEPRMLELLHESGVAYFDTASLPEIALVKDTCPGATCYFMGPAKLRGAARRAYTEYGVRHFVLDHRDELDALLREIPGRDITLFVRMAAHGPDSTYELSSKFGAPPAACVELLRAASDAGTMPALAFNVGSLVLRPSAYREALSVCREVIEQAEVAVSQLDIGGGFPSPYPEVETPSLARFFEVIAAARAGLPLPADAELLGEPGRALAAEGMSVLTQVVLRKEDRVYLNDGIYGSLLEPVISHGLVRFPTRVYRLQGEASDRRRPFTLYGPTCDSLDVLPKPFWLPVDIRRGDWVEFGILGAYSHSMRTHFNGFFPDTVVEIGEPAALPPGASGAADE
ncbi:MAG: type III PLP-dependent enzyme [Gammaproteobacteria bacterium]|nr:type III PLP-dependent enzyme [Gammaproteobacteria bacterium]NIR83708.1 type III PLP-dependent enzyme [Gammaproteobacteria bacterium]NIR91855.1 type III PLP-dependent enzyme [Gammaproteobacteria bacterium]NIU04874.1 type III PLP-dependent enzyme [Gammaproteobacteria bacterium]NIV51856.1 type III PLP-dependent enzyme [Gammaproteobacteria bacterium]